MREGLIPKTDLFGDTIKNPERLWPGSPFSTQNISTDKVRVEAARLGFATPHKPSSIDVLPGVSLGKADKVALTPAQKDVFNTTAGQFAYNILAGEVNKPNWDQMSGMEQRRIFEVVFKKGRDMATKQQLTGLVEAGAHQEAIQKVKESMHK